jgi:hypothetical protein
MLFQQSLMFVGQGVHPRVEHFKDASLGWVPALPASQERLDRDEPAIINYICKIFHIIIFILSHKLPALPQNIQLGVEMFFFQKTHQLILPKCNLYYDKSFITLCTILFMLMKREIKHKNEIVNFLS